MKKNTTILKIFLCVFFASISALGALPYGYHFSDFLRTYNLIFSVIAGIIFAATAVIANIALGAYSLLHFKLKQKNISIIYLLLISLVSAIAYGCTNFFAYAKTLPLAVNSLMTFAVISTNAAIAWVALSNTLADLRLHWKVYVNKIHFFMKWVGFGMGILASITLYAAAAHGISSLLIHYFRPAIANYLGFGISIIVWIPNAALFGNSTQVCFETFYYWVGDMLKKHKSINKELNKKKIAILLLALFSSVSYAQIAITFLDAHMSIPNFFKLPEVQLFTHYFIVPLALFTASFVNYLALNRALELACS